MTVGEKIRELRKAKGLTQKELAARSGIHPVTIRKYETNVIKPLLPQLYKLSEGLEVNLDELVSVTISETVDNFQRRKTVMDERIADICLKSVKEHGGTALQYIPKEVMTEEMCIAAIENTKPDDAKLVLPYISDELLTTSVCNTAVSCLYNALELIPEAKVTKEMCLTAVEKYTLPLKFVPKRFQTEDVWEVAVKNHGSAICHIPEEKRTKRLCMAAFKSCAWSITDIPAKFITVEMCVTALENNLYSREAILAHVLPDVAEQASEIVRKQEEDDKKMTERAYENIRIISQNPSAFKSLTLEARKNPVLCQAAVEMDGMLLRFVPKELRSLDICYIAVDRDVDAMFFVPEEVRETVIQKIKDSSTRLKIIFGESDFKELFL